MANPFSDLAEDLAQQSVSVAEDSHASEDLSNRPLENPSSKRTHPDDEGVVATKKPRIGREVIHGEGAVIVE